MTTLSARTAYDLRLPLLFALLLPVSGCRTEAALGTIDSGSIEVISSAGGKSTDADGYTVTLDGQTVRRLAGNGVVLFRDLSVGDHSLELGDIAANCTAPGGRTQSATVSPNGKARVTYVTTCIATGGAVDVGLATLGVPRRSGYQVRIDGVPQPELLGDQARLLVEDLSPGDHLVELAGIPAECSIVSPNPRTVTLVAGTVTPITFDATCVPGGRLLFTSTITGNQALFVMDAGGSTPEQLGTGQEVGGGQWSPDGTRIAYTGYLNGNNEIYVMNADGSGVVNLTQTADTSEYSPRWSPTGDRILFTVSDSIYLMNADGSGRTLLLGSASQPSWSPDGSRIVFVRRTGTCNVLTGCDSDLRMLWVASRTVTALLTSPGIHQYRSPAWSPDGAHIAFHSMREVGFFNFVRGIARVSSNGQGETLMFTGDTGPIWSPDSKLIATAVLETRGYEIHLHDIAAGGGSLVLSDSTIEGIPNSWR